MKITLYPKYLIHRLFVTRKQDFFCAGYKCLYPECVRDGMTPWQHYVIFGRSKGYNDGLHPDLEQFFADGYLLMYPDVAKAKTDPWKHYVQYGRKEGRDNGLHPSSEQFFADGYLLMYPDVAKAKTDPWKHYVQYGRKEGRDNGLHPNVKQFFSDGYNLMYLDVSRAKVNPWKHYVRYGKEEGRDNGWHPKPDLFIPELYLALYADIRAAKVDPWYHYAKFGFKEKRRTSLSPFFDNEWYLKQYPEIKEDPDVQSGVMNPEAHYLFKGWKKGYDPSVNFDTKYYLDRYADVREIQICPLVHYLTVGKIQNRRPYDVHDLNEIRTLTELPESYESGLKSRECSSVNLNDLESDALLIVLAEHLGDVIANEPIARYLKFRYPNRSIYWVIESRFREIVRYNPCLDGYIEVKSLKDCLAVTRSLKDDQKIVNLFFDGRLDNVANPKCVWYAKNRGIGVNNYFLSDCLLSAMSQAAGMERLLLAPKFWVGDRYANLSKEEVFQKVGLADQIKKIEKERGRCRIVLLQTKSNDQRKDWTKSKFSELTIDILKKYPDVIVAEIGKSHEVECKQVRFKSLDTLTDLQLIYQLIIRSDLFIGIDSSFMHMANAGMVRSISIMGTYELFGNVFNNYCPYSGRFWEGVGITYIRANYNEKTSNVPEEAVMSAVTDILG